MEPSEVTELLGRWRDGDHQALDRLMPLVYQELRRIARSRLTGERAGHSLAPTDLLHEAVARLMEANVPWNDRVHFFAVAAGTMRRVLIDRARHKLRHKRGGGAVAVTLQDSDGLDVSDPESILALHRGLEKLEKRDARKARVLELHFFAGLTYQETAQVLEISEATVDRDLRFARAWLQNELMPTTAAPGGSTL